MLLQDKLDFLHLPIIDGSVTSDTALSRLADDCNMRVLRGKTAPNAARGSRGEAVGRL